MKVLIENEIEIEVEVEVEVEIKNDVEVRLEGSIFRTIGYKIPILFA